MDYIMFEDDIDVKGFNDKLLNNILYKSVIDDNKLILNLGDEDEKN